MKTIPLFTALLLVFSLLLTSCNWNPPVINPPGGGGGGGTPNPPASELKLHISIENPEDVHVNIESVYLVEFSHYSHRRAILSKADFNNGKFDIVLPGEVDSAYLVNITNKTFWFNGIPDISDKEAMITEVPFRLCAFTGDTWQGDIIYEKPNFTAKYQPNELVYVDRDVLVSIANVNYYFTKGWNYIRYAESEAEVVPPIIMWAHNDFDALKWYYEGYSALEK